MKLQTTPIAVMKRLISAHLKKRAEDDETATMLAIKPAMAGFFGEQTADRLLQDRAFKDYFYVLRAAQTGTVFHRPQTQTQKPEIV